MTHSQLDILSLTQDVRFTISSGSELRYHFTIGGISSDRRYIQIGCVVEADGKMVENAQISYDTWFNAICIVCGCGECLCTSPHAEDICEALNLISTDLEDIYETGVCTEHDCGKRFDWSGPVDVVYGEAAHDLDVFNYVYPPESEPETM